jgi:hypothetical protein
MPEVKDPPDEEDTSERGNRDRGQRPVPEPDQRCSVVEVERRRCLPYRFSATQIEEITRAHINIVVAVTAVNDDTIPIAEMDVAFVKAISSDDAKVRTVFGVVLSRCADVLALYPLSLLPSTLHDTHGRTRVQRLRHRKGVARKVPRIEFKRGPSPNTRKTTPRNRANCRTNSYGGGRRGSCKE